MSKKKEDKVAEKPAKKPTRLIRASHWNKYHEWPPQGGMRHLIFFAKECGFEKVIRRVGPRTILIDEQAFFDWIEEQDKKHV